MYKLVNVAICESDTGVVCGSFKKRLLFNQNADGERIVSNWFQSYLKGVKKGNNLVLQVVINDPADMHVVTPGLF